MQPEGRSELGLAKEGEAGIASLFRCSLTPARSNAVDKTAAEWMKMLYSIEDGFPLPAEDARRLLRDIHESADTFAVNFDDEFPSAEAFARFLRDLHRRPGALFLAARGAGGLLGFLLIEPRRAGKLRHTADLHMGVRADARGQGAGSALLAAALDRLNAQTDIEIVYLMVRADNEPALRLYRRHGFEQLARLPRDTKIGTRYYDGLLMRLDLARE